MWFYFCFFKDTATTEIYTYGHALSPHDALRISLGFVAGLHRRFDGRRRALREARAERQRAFDSGALPDFLPETASIRAGNWRVGDIPADLFDRRVEITGPTDRKMVVNALNSGAKVFMADLQDATAASRANIFEGPATLVTQRTEKRRLGKKVLRKVKV